MAQRVTLRKRQPYNTTSNRRRVVKTPGGKLVVHHIKKLAVSLARTGMAWDWIEEGWEGMGRIGVWFCWSMRGMVSDVEKVWA
jgi:hypothetical protein